MCNKVFSGLVEKSKTTMGWFFGFKVQLIANDRGGLISVRLTKDIDDRQPVPKMIRDIFGNLFGDSAFMSFPSKLFLANSSHIPRLCKISTDGTRELSKCWYQLFMGVLTSDNAITRSFHVYP